jgi:hypothetical protein
MPSIWRPSRSSGAKPLPAAPRPATGRTRRRLRRQRRRRAERQRLDLFRGRVEIDVHARLGRMASSVHAVGRVERRLPGDDRPAGGGWALAASSSGSSSIGRTRRGPAARRAISSARSSGSRRMPALAGSAVAAALLRRFSAMRRSPAPTSRWRGFLLRPAGAAAGCVRGTGPRSSAPSSRGSADARDHDDLVGGRKLHDLARREQRPCGLLPRHHQMPSQGDSRCPA